MAAFTEEVTRIAPDAGGPRSPSPPPARTIVDAFRTAAMGALLAILVILSLILRRPLDVILVVAPLMLSALLTLYVAVLLWLPLNFANIIALPLLLGVGVSFNVYFIMNWRAGPDRAARFRDGAGGAVLRADHRHRVRLAGAVRPSRHGEHGGVASDQPGMHADREFAIRAVGSGRSGVANARALTRRARRHRDDGSAVAMPTGETMAPCRHVPPGRARPLGHWHDAVREWSCFRADLLPAAPGSRRTGRRIC